MQNNDRSRSDEDRSDDPWDDDREWNDPPGVDVRDDGTTSDESKGALNVATEGESFVREDGYEREPITPGDVSLEGALFVVLGVALTLFTAAQFVI